jgi:hypothetical protein
MPWKAMCLQDCGAFTCLIAASFVRKVVLNWAGQNCKLIITSGIQKQGFSEMMQECLEG